MENPAFKSTFTLLLPVNICLFRITLLKSSEVHISVLTWLLNTVRTCTNLFCVLPLTCVFGSFPIHRPRRRSPLPAILWLSRVALIRRLSWARIRTSRSHWSRRVVRVSWIWLCHVHRWRVTLRYPLAWVAWSWGGIVCVWRGLLKIHLWCGERPKWQKKQWWYKKKNAFF